MKWPQATGICQLLPPPALIASDFIADVCVIFQPVHKWGERGSFLLGEGFPTCH